MKTLRSHTFAAIVVVWVGLLARSAADGRMAARQDRVLTGELVVTDAGKNQFRIVDQAGFFHAPAGMSLEALDGKPVVVELSPNGNVLQITEKPIHIDPMTYRYEIISGQLVVTDAQTGSFTITGDKRLYVAPPAIDIRPYAGRMVDVLIDERGEVSSIEPAGRSQGPAAAGAVCSYNGQGYSDGASLCQSGTEHRCEGGTWRSLGVLCTAFGRVPCGVSGVSYPDGTTRCAGELQVVCEHGRWRNLGTACVSDTTASRSSRDCLLGGDNFADGTAICRNRMTYRCAAGQWVNVATACD